MAAFLNKVLLIGNLTREPELRYTNGSNNAVCEFGMAINRRFVQNGQERDETCFIDVVTWGKQAETCSHFLQKGATVFVEGRLAYETWTDKEGKRRSQHRVTADRVQFLNSSRKDIMNDGGSMQGGADGTGAMGGNGGGYANYGRPQQQSRFTRQNFDGNGGFYQQPRNYGGMGGNMPQGPATAPMGDMPQNNNPQPPVNQGAMPPQQVEQPPENIANPMEDVDDIPF